MAELRRAPNRDMNLRLEVDQGRKRIVVRATGADGQSAEGELDLANITHLIAKLSHCEHALVLLEAGQTPALPIDPDEIFARRPGEFKLRALDELRRFEAGVDDTRETVALIFWGKSARLSGYRLSPDIARSLAQELQAAADAVPNPPPKKYQN